MWFDHTGPDERGIHRKRTQPAKENGGALAIDLTPMLDVVMIMLIFFIVAGSFVREATIETQRKPTSSAESDQPSEHIIVHVAADDQVWLDGRRIDLRSVRANISQKKALSPKATVIIKANNKSHLDPVVAVADAAREAGIFQVTLSTSD